MDSFTRGWRAADPLSRDSPAPDLLPSLPVPLPRRRTAHSCRSEDRRRSTSRGSLVRIRFPPPLLTSCENRIASRIARELAAHPVRSRSGTWIRLQGSSTPDPLQAVAVALSVILGSSFLTAPSILVIITRLGPLRPADPNRSGSRTEPLPPVGDLVMERRRRWWRQLWPATVESEGWLAVGMKTDGN